MEFALVFVVGVVSVVAVAVAVLAGKLGVAAPLGLVVVGLVLSFVPGVPHPEVEPEWVLAGVLPPLLYAGAVSMPVTDFRRDLKPITGLAVLLVVVSTLGCGWLFHGLVPGIGWAASFALGAVVSPTDAVAATAVGHRLGLPHRLMTLLEGEGLVNDASALVLLRSAVAAIAGTVSLWGVVGDFAWSVVFAAVVGAVVGVVNVRVRGLLGDAVLSTAVSFVVPFVAYVPAEEGGASGVLAVVVAGLVTGHLSPRYLRAQDRIAEATNWRTLAFLLESAIFLLMGLSVKGLVDEVSGQDAQVWRAVWTGLAACGLLIVLRAVFTVPLVGILYVESRRAQHSGPQLERMSTRLDEADRTTEGSSVVAGQGKRLSAPKSAARRERYRRRVQLVRADADFYRTQTLGWRGGAVLAWAGMRGAITVAAAQTLPQSTASRPLLVLIAFVVAAFTLLLQGLTLPVLIRAVRVPPDDPERLVRDYGSLLGSLGEAAREVLDDPALARGDGSGYDPEVVRQVRVEARVPHDGAEQPRRAPRSDPREQYAELQLRVLDAEGRRLLAERARGDCSSVVLTRVQRALDIEAARLQQLMQEDR